MPDLTKTVVETPEAEPVRRPRSGGRILVDALRIHGSERVFCVPGESYLDILDALYDTEIQLIVAKHEGAAANMAEADGKLTGRPGICMVTRGPGATHASVGVHTAFQDSTPMILFIGQVARGVRGREAFQEVEFRQMFAPLTKWVAEIESAERIPEYLLRAFQCATSGRPGPVVLALPEDVLAESSDVADASPFCRVQPSPTQADLDAVRAELTRAKRPIIIVGGSGWSEEACKNLEQFVEANALPVAASFRRQDLLNNLHPSYIGHLSLGMAPYLAKRVKSADLIIALGTRLGDISTGSYTLLSVPKPKQRLVHIHPGAEELGSVYQADLAMQASASLFAEQLRRIEPVDARAWRSWTEEGRREFLEFTSLPKLRPHGVDMAAVVSHLAKRLPSDAIISNGAGNFTVWVHRYFKYKQRATELAPTSGSMGYGFPAAISAKLRYPDRISVCFAGDGCFLMYPQELATAVQYDAAVITLIVNNGMYGTIRMHQERRFPGRISGTRLDGPDFVALAKSFGAYAERVETTEAFEDAFERALEARRPAVLELRVDSKQITPDRRLE
jgi:acetolactate synthase I/II/III large subunit